MEELIETLILILSFAFLFLPAVGWLGSGFKKNYKEALSSGFISFFSVFIVAFAVKLILLALGVDG